MALRNKMLHFFTSFLVKNGKKTNPVETSIYIRPQCDTVPNAKGKFGYVKSNPIPVFYPFGERHYLNCLRCRCGQPFDHRRLGSCGPGPDGHVVDQFELICRSGKHRITLYMDMYHLGYSSLIPKRLTKADNSLL